jgi:hypothetical protein
MQCTHNGNGWMLPCAGKNDMTNFWSVLGWIHECGTHGHRGPTVFVIWRQKNNNNKKSEVQCIQKVWTEFHKNYPLWKAASGSNFVVLICLYSPFPLSVLILLHYQVVGFILKPNNSRCKAPPQSPVSFTIKLLKGISGGFNVLRSSKMAHFSRLQAGVEDDLNSHPPSHCQCWTP